MDPIYTVGIVAVLAVGVAAGVLYAIPKTRPYLKTWWPVGVIVVITILVALLFRRKPAEVRGSQTGSLDEALQEAKSTLLEEQIRAETAKVKSDCIHDAVEDELTRVNQILDPYEQAAAKKRLLNKVRGY